MRPVIDVRPMPQGGWVATCDCGTHRTYEQQVDAWEWVTSHACEPAEPRRLLRQRGDY